MSDKSAPDPETLALLPDRRAIHFWDAEHTLPEIFRAPLGLSVFCPAWDVYLIYPPGVRWEKTPPAPAYWQHQLGKCATAPRLDGKTFAAELRKMLDRK